MPKYGFLGLGIMGQAMAANLVKAGYDVTVWNRTADKCEPLLALGAMKAQTPAEVMAACDICFAMVSDPAAALDLCFAGQGVLEGMKEGKAYVDISTVDAETAIAIDKAVRARGGRYLEAPVSGSKKPAEDGTLVFLCGGDEELYREASPALEIMGKALFHLGEVGSGARMKLVVNMTMGTMMNALGEGLALAGKTGLDAETLLQVFSQGAIDNPMFSMKGPLMARGEYPTAFPLKHMQKDMRLALQLGEQAEQPLPVAAAANAQFIKAKRQGGADSDFSAVFDVIR